MLGIFELCVGHGTSRIEAMRLAVDVSAALPLMSKSSADVGTAAMANPPALRSPDGGEAGGAAERPTKKSGRTPPRRDEREERGGAWGVRE